MPPYMEVYNFAAGDRNEEIPFLISRQNTGGSKIRMGEWNRKAYLYDSARHRNGANEEAR